MGAVLEYSHEADEDLLSLHAFLSQRNPDLADRTIRQLDAKCNQLAEQPRSGTPKDTIRLGMRMGILGKYLIFYRIELNGIFVVRIVHGARDLRRIFPKR